MYVCMFECMCVLRAAAIQAQAGADPYLERHGPCMSAGEDSKRRCMFRCRSVSHHNVLHRPELLEAIRQGLVELHRRVHPQ